MSSDPARGESRRLTGLSVGEAAARVGVSASTLRTWEHRYGLAPSGRSVGGHRRYTLTDVARLQRVRRLTAGGMATADAAAASTTNAPARRPRAHPPLRRFHPFAEDRLIHGLLDAADALDTAAIARATQTLLRERGAIRTWADVLVPVLQQIGRYWQREHHGVECEHLITDALQAVLLAHTWNHRHKSVAHQAHVLLAAAPAEGHTLPLYAVAAALAERGITSRVLGTVPPPSLIVALDQLSPAAVVLWARTRDTTDQSLLAAVRTRVPLVCAAGAWPTRTRAGASTSNDLPSTVRMLADWM